MLDCFGGTETGTAIARNLQGDQTPEDPERLVVTMYRAEVDIQVLSFSNGVHPEPRRC
jgi:hypothetical protein